MDAAGIQACASVARLISDLQSRTVPTAQARRRLTGIYDMARSCSTPQRPTGIRLDAERADRLGRMTRRLLVMAEQFAAAACR